MRRHIWNSVWVIYSIIIIISQILNQQKRDREREIERGVCAIFRSRQNLTYQSWHSLPQPENRGNIPENYPSPAEREREGE